MEFQEIESAFGERQFINELEKAVRGCAEIRKTLEIWSSRR
jgi:hypothetical protein